MPIIETEEYMAKKRLFLTLVFCAFFFKAHAATVSFLVIETGVSGEAPAKQHSGIWESGLMDVFFEAGHIVSNAPILRLDNKPLPDRFPQEAAGDLQEAARGGAEYFIIAQLDYDSRGTLPDKVLLTIYRISPLAKLYEQRYEIRPSRSTREEYDSVKAAASGLIPHLTNR
jgi:hypothetical protein